MIQQNSKSRAFIAAVVSLALAGLIAAILWFSGRDFEPIIAFIVAGGTLVGALELIQHRLRDGLVVVTAALVVVAAAIFAIMQINSAGTIRVSVRVSDQNAAPVPGARVVIFSDSPILSQYTDSLGAAAFDINQSPNSARLFVETEQYRIYDQTFERSANQTIEARLTERSADDRSVIVRAVNDADSKPVAGASVLLIVESNTFTEATDTNGIAKFTITFSGETIEADLTVNSPQFQVNNQQVTLRPDTLQDIRLQPGVSESVLIATLDSPTVTPPASLTPDPALIYGMTVDGFISEPAQSQKYQFTGKTGDAVLIRVTKVSGDLWPKITFHDSAGLELQEAGSSVGGEINFTLLADGQYSILVQDGFRGTGTGGYSLHLQKVN